MPTQSRGREDQKEDEKAAKAGDRLQLLSCRSWRQQLQVGLVKADRLSRVFQAQQTASLHQNKDED